MFDPTPLDRNRKFQCSIRDNDRPLNDRTVLRGSFTMDEIAAKLKALFSSAPQSTAPPPEREANG